MKRSTLQKKMVKLGISRQDTSLDYSRTPSRGDGMFVCDEECRRFSTDAGF